MLVELQRENAALRAKLAEIEAPTEWKPLKAAAFVTGQRYETLRRWSRAGKIISEKKDGRVFVDIDSVHARLKRLQV
jgi:hypothetical protein